MKYRAWRDGCAWNGLVFDTEAGAWAECINGGEEPRQGELVMIERVREARLRDFIRPSDVTGVIAERMAEQRIDDSAITNDAILQPLWRELEAALGSALDDVQGALQIVLQGYTGENAKSYRFPRGPE